MAPNQVYVLRRSCSAYSLVADATSTAMECAPQTFAACREPGGACGSNHPDVLSSSEPKAMTAPSHRVGGPWVCADQSSRFEDITTILARPLGDR
jgi:hypothetical protein